MYNCQSGPCLFSPWTAFQTFVFPYAARLSCTLSHLLHSARVLPVATSCSMRSWQSRTDSMVYLGLLVLEALLWVGFRSQKISCHYTATCRSRSLPPDEQLLLALLLVGFLEQPHKRHVPGSCHLLTFILHCLLHVQPRRPKPSSWPSRRIRSVLYGVVHLPILICRMCAAHTFIQYVSSFCPAILIFTVF